MVDSMLALGLSLMVAQIIQPLKNARMVILALGANFILVPALLFGITALIPDSVETRIDLEDDDISHLEPEELKYHRIMARQ